MKGSSPYCCPQLVSQEGRIKPGRNPPMLPETIPGVPLSILYKCHRGFGDDDARQLSLDAEFHIIQWLTEIEGFLDDFRLDNDKNV